MGVLLVLNKVAIAKVFGSLVLRGVSSYHFGVRSMFTSVIVQLELWSRAYQWECSEGLSFYLGGSVDFKGRDRGNGISSYYFRAYYFAASGTSFRRMRGLLTAPLWVIFSSGFAFAS